MSFEERFPDIPIIDFTEKYKSIGRVCRCKDIEKHLLSRKNIGKYLKILIEKNREGMSYNEMTPNRCGYEYALKQLIEVWGIDIDD